MHSEIIGVLDLTAAELHLPTALLKSVNEPYLNTFFADRRFK